MATPTHNLPGPIAPGRGGHGSRRKIVLRTLAILSGVFLLLLAALAVGGWWIENRYLRDEIRLGEDSARSVRAHGAHFDWWKLNFFADSIWYRSPALDARIGAAELRVDWAGGVLALRPAVRLEADSLFLRLRADTAARKKTPLDSLFFPDFSIPLAVHATVRGVRVEDDSGALTIARGVSVRTRGGQRARARIARTETRWTGALAFGASAALNWSDADSLFLRVAVTRGKDAVSLQARHAKRPLWRGRSGLRANLRDPAPYLRAFDLDSALPDMEGIRLRATASLGDSLKFTLRAEASTRTWRVNPDFALGPQSVMLSAAWKHDRGTAAFTSEGAQGEDVRVAAEARLLTPPRPLGAGADSTLSPLWRRMAASVEGHARGLRVRVRDTLRTADLLIEKAEWDGRNLAVAVATGDSSRVEAAALLAGPPRARKGSFRATVRPDDRWVKVFLGNTVTFAALDARGEYEDETITAVVAARDLKAYGFELDSVRTHHAYFTASGVYVLESSRLYADKDVWSLSGTLKPAPSRADGGGIDLDATLAGEGHGSLRYTLVPDGTMEAAAKEFEATALPYRPLDGVPLREAVLDGAFRWNPKRKDGRADLRARGVYRSEKIQAHAAGSWDARRMEVEGVSLRFGKSVLNARALLRLDGKQFHQAATLRPDQYERVAVETPGFDLAEALAILQTEPALTSGSVKGELTYAVADGENLARSRGGFGGALVFDAITPSGAPGGATLENLRLEGRGDTLLISGRAESETAGLLNASVRVAVTGALADSQHVRADIVAGDSLRARLDAVTGRFRSFRGTLRVEGSAVLPEKSGSVENVKVDLDFNVPFPDPMTRSTLTARAFEGVYVLPGLTRQHVSLDPALRNGVFRVPHFSVKNDQGQALSGSLEYALPSGNLKAHLEGGRFAAQWGDDYEADLQNLRADIARDSSGLRMEGAFSRGTFLFADPPLRASGTLTNVDWSYALPSRALLSKDRRAENPSRLRFTGDLSESLVRYRLKSLADLQKLFRGDRKRRTGPPLRLDVRVRTLGNRNRIDSDILRLTWVGNLSVRGEHPFALYNGRINALSGGLGLDRQAYDIRALEVKWLNAPLEEGRIAMESRKQLATDCAARGTEVDSCTVITRLDGDLGDMLFSYDSDCGGSFGAGANVAAILYSVQRGCYDPSLVTGGDGRGYGDKALTLLEPTLNRGLSGLVGRYSGAWIEQTEITGLGSLSREEPGGDTLGEALSLELTSREYLRLRLKIRSGYHTSSPDLSNPWEHMLALEWRPPVENVIEDPVWKQRLRDNLRVVASVQTKPEHATNPEDDQVEKKIGLNYAYFFWGNWWNRPVEKAGKREEDPEPSDASPGTGTSRAAREGAAP